MFAMTAFFGLALAAVVQNAESPQRIVAASNVRLRTEPQATADEVARLSLGTILKELQSSPDTAWLRVQSAEGQTGWIFAILTAPYNDRDSAAISKRLLQARLQIESLNFADAVDLFDFATRINAQAQGAARAEFDLLRLRALSRVAHGIMAYEPRDASQREWLSQHEDKVVYSEPAGQWLVDAKLYWDLEEKQRGNPVAEELAWDGANAGVPGECEGYIPCTLAVALMTSGRYLDLYPSGTHSAESIEYIDYPLREILKPDTGYTMDPRENAELRQSITALSRILGRTSSPLKNDVLSRLKLIEQKYR